jgi:hypothetical protein
VANSNRRNNPIKSLLVNRSVSSNQSKIREHIVLFYNRLFIEQFIWQPKPDGLVFDSIDEEEGTWLEGLFEEYEVLEVVRGMNSDKASNLDAFTMAFFQAC